MAEAAVPLADWMARSLDARLAGVPVLPPAAYRDACAAFAEQAEPAGGPPALGLGPADLPAAWRDALAWAGMPLSPHGSLRWGRDLGPGGAAVPAIEQGRLLLPPPEALVQLTSLALKPLRRWVADRLGCRLQAAPGIRLWLWPGRAVALSTSAIPLAGFVYGSAPGHRAGLALDPGAWQIVTW